MPITVTMQGTGSPSTQNFMVTLTITRVSTLDSISGVGISQFVSGQQ